VNYEYWCRSLSAAVRNYGDIFHSDRFPSPVIPAKAGIVRLKAHLVREVEVLFRYALSGL
jgi:hypothetical protein